MEPVLRARIADDLVREGGLAIEGLAELLDVGDRDAAVGVTEQAEPRRREPCGVADQRLEEGQALGHDAATVEADRYPERASRRDQERHPAAEAESDDADPRIVEAGPSEVR